MLGKYRLTNKERMRMELGYTVTNKELYKIQRGLSKSLGIYWGCDELEGIYLSRSVFYEIVNVKNLLISGIDLSLKFASFIEALGSAGVTQGEVPCKCQGGRSFWYHVGGVTIYFNLGYDKRNKLNSFDSIFSADYQYDNIDAIVDKFLIKYPSIELWENNLRGNGGRYRRTLEKLILTERDLKDIEKSNVFYR